MLDKKQLQALDALQSQLARIYRVEEFAPVSSFVIDEATLDRMSKQGVVRGRASAREEVFVLDDGHEVNVAVFLDEKAREAAVQAVGTGEISLHADGFAAKAGLFEDGQ